MQRLANRWGEAFAACRASRPGQDANVMTPTPIDPRWAGAIILARSRPTLLSME